MIKQIDMKIGISDIEIKFKNRNFKELFKD